MRSYFDLVRNTLSEIKASGRLRDVDLTVAAFSVIGMILWCGVHTKAFFSSL